MIRDILAAILYPLLLGGALLVAGLAMAAGAPEGPLVAAISVSGAGLLLLLQHTMPYRQDWRARPWEFSIDMVHMLVSTGLIGSLVKAGGLWLVVELSVSLGTSAGLGWWPSSLPWAIQLLFALLLGEWGQYWVHRICHESPLLWRIHALHHSSKQLYVLSAGRTHPIGVALSSAALLLPTAALGAPPEVLALLGVFTGMNGMLQHANCQMDLRLWNRLLFSTADFHRWHHSIRSEEGNANYGSNLMIYDWLFGTILWPAPSSSPEKLGIGGMRWPDRLWVHLASPFRWEPLLTEAD